MFDISFFNWNFFLGVRDQPLDWQTAPPVHVLSYLVLGGKKDAMSREVRFELEKNGVWHLVGICRRHALNTKGKRKARAKCLKMAETTEQRETLSSV